MDERRSNVATRPVAELDAARRLAKQAGEQIRPEFGRRTILQYRGLYDVQLKADVTAQEIIVKKLSEIYPDHGVVSEENLPMTWSSAEFLWVVDPLDGTNNFGYGIAHCAVAITLFQGNQVKLAVIYDPMLRREFYSAADARFPDSAAIPASNPSQATVSLVTDYSQAGRSRAMLVESVLSCHCKRVASLWAPSLDLALVAVGELDAIVCSSASLLDVCGGLFMVESMGGCVLDMKGNSLTVSRAMHDQPIAFVASRSAALAQDLVELVQGLRTDQ
jgi:myo-inositol-1(or 4)-monophosphatase